jgi:hypothetical protein
MNLINSFDMCMFICLLAFAQVFKLDIHACVVYASSRT